jgi:hypothetical protein
MSMAFCESLQTLSNRDSLSHRLIHNPDEQEQARNIPRQRSQKVAQIRQYPLCPMKSHRIPLYPAAG